MKIFILAGMLLSAFLIYGCSDDSIVNPGGPNMSGYTFISSSFAEGSRARVDLYSASAFTTGYNKLFVVLYDSLTGDLITDAHIEFSAVNHGEYAPVENPGSIAVNGIFEGAIVFTAAQTDMPHWHFHIHIHNHSIAGEPSGEAEVTLSSISDHPDKFKRIVTADSSIYYFSFIEPAAPVSGNNVLKVLVNKSDSTSSPGYSGFTITGNAMHLQSGNSTGAFVITHTTGGYYTGTMLLNNSGNWRADLQFSNGIISDSTNFQFSY